MSITVGKRFEGTAGEEYYVCPDKDVENLSVDTAIGSIQLERIVDAFRSSVIGVTLESGSTVEELILALASLPRDVLIKPFRTGLKADPYYFDGYHRGTALCFEEDCTGTLVLCVRSEETVALLPRQQVIHSKGEYETVYTGEVLDTLSYYP